MNQMNNKVAISVLLNNTLLQANGLCRFTYIPTGKHYLIYNLNEKSLQNGKELNKVYVSETGDANTEFIQISQDEWTTLKSIMSDLGVPNAEIPRNVQLSALQATQYVVGPYRKIAINDDLMANILNNQLDKEPKDNVVMPTGNTTFFDKTVTEDTDPTVNQEESVIPNAFTMAAPAPESIEEAAPAALVSQPTPVSSPTVSPVIQNEDKEKVVQALKVFLDYVGADMNKVNEILNMSNYPTINQETPVVEQEESVPVQTPSVIDINNLPVVNQEPVAEEHVLQEETFVPTAPSMPVDTMVSSTVLPATQAPVENVPQTIEQPVTSVAETPAAPVAETPQVIEQPVAQTTQDTPAMVEQPIVQSQMETPVVPVATVEQPQVVEQVQPVQTQIIENPVVQPQVEAPVQLNEPIIQQTIEPVSMEQPIVQETAAPTELVQPVVNTVEPVQTQLVEPTQVVPNNPVQSDTVQNTTVNLAIPEENTAPAVAPVEVPSIDLTNVTVQPTPVVEQPTQSNGNLSFLDAGPVVMPDGQQNVQSLGLPGDSGAKILEKAA